MPQHIPAWGIPIGEEDSLYLRARTNNTAELIRLRATILRDDGTKTIADLLLATSASVPNFLARQRLPRGHLILLTATDENAQLNRGECFVHAGLLYGGTTFADATAALIADYIGGNSPLAWPGQTLQGLRSGPGNLKVITVANPAATAEITVTVPDNETWRLLAMRYTLTTAAGGPVRISRLLIDPISGQVGLPKMQPGISQAASLGREYNWALNLEHFDSAIPDISTTRIADMTLQPGVQIITQTSNIQTGDQYDQTRLYVESHMSDA